MVQSQQNYIGINGIVTQDLNSIIAELKNDFKGIYGENINLESNTSDGQWLNILAQQKIDALDFQVQLYNNLDVDSVVGLPQQVLYKLNGLTIKDFTYSFVYVNVTVSQNVSLSGLDSDIANTDGTGYTVTDINGNNWILAESISLVQNDEPYLLLFRAQELGQITALANTITTMSTIVAGVTEVNNPANNFITGQTGETAAEFRTRRNRSLQAPSQGFKESIEGQLLALNDVSDAKVYDNKDDANIDGVQVIVQGGTSNEIGNIIYNNLPPGINTQGAYEATITVNNRNKVLNYDKPNPIPILVKGTIESLTGYPNDVDLDYVKQTLASKQFNIGEIAESANITTELKNILGETGSPYDVELSLGFTSGQWETPISIDGETYNAIIFDGTTYIAAGNNSKIATSTDLTNWSIQNVGVNDNWIGIAYGNNMYVSISESGYIAISSDLTLWDVRKILTELDILTSSNAIVGNNIKYINDKFVFTIYDTYQMKDFIVYTTDFDTYNYISSVRTGYVDYNRWYDFIYENSKYIFVGGRTNYGYISTSEDLTNITSTKIGNDKINGILYNNNTYILVGDNGCVSISTDLQSFNTVQVGSNNWNKVGYVNGVYVIVGNNGYIAMSSDLEHWETQKIGTDNWNNVFYYNTTIGIIGKNISTYTFPSIDWQEILTSTGLADFYVMTVSGMDNLTVLGAD